MSAFLLEVRCRTQNRWSEYEAGDMEKLSETASASENQKFKLPGKRCAPHREHRRKVSAHAQSSLQYQEKDGQLECAKCWRLLSPDIQSSLTPFLSYRWEHWRWYSVGISFGIDPGHLDPELMSQIRRCSPRMSKQMKNISKLDYRGNESGMRKKEEDAVRNWREERWWRTLRPGYTSKMYLVTILEEGKWPSTCRECSKGARLQFRQSVHLPTSPGLNLQHWEKYNAGGNLKYGLRLVKNLRAPSDTEAGEMLGTKAHWRVIHYRDSAQPGCTDKTSHLLVSVEGAECCQSSGRSYQVKIQNLFSLNTEFVCLWESTET